MELAAARVRQVHLGAMAAAVVLLLLSLAFLGGGGNAAARLVVILLLVVLLGVQAWLVLRQRRLDAVALADAAWAEPEPTAETAAAEAPATPRMVIRCKQCGEVFPVEDTGERPLVAHCPHCGKAGTIKVKSDAPPK